MGDVLCLRLETCWWMANGQAMCDEDLLGYFAPFRSSVKAVWNAVCGCSRLMCFQRFRV